MSSACCDGRCRPYRSSYCATLSARDPFRASDASTTPCSPPTRCSPPRRMSPSTCGGAGWGLDDGVSRRPVAGPVPGWWVHYPANDTWLHVDPASRVIHRAPPVDSATPCWSVSKPTSENPPGGPVRATVQAPPDETRMLPFHEKRLPVIAVTPFD